MNIEMTIEIPEDIFMVLKKDKDDLKQDIMQKAAIQFYLEKKLSLERAAIMCRLSRMEFIDILSHMGIPIFDYSNEDLVEIHRESEKILEKFQKA
jgi:predicted HTH domain antitoxin